MYEHIALVLEDNCHIGSKSLLRIMLSPSPRSGHSWETHVTSFYSPLLDRLVLANMQLMTFLS